MSRIPLRRGFSLIPEGTYVFRVYEVTHDEEFGKIEAKLVNAKGQTIIQRFNYKKTDDEYNEPVLNFFSFFARTVMQDMESDDVDPVDMTNHYVKATVVHTEVESTKNPGKMNTFANLKDFEEADGFDETPTERALTLGVPAEPKESASGLDLDDLLE